ncbi:transposable element Tcb1 transposase [Trichonephila clavipes]|nr:transposable element Tcb1 transposase [Trichonephila clavipes]
MKKLLLREKIIDGTVNSVVVSGDGTWKTRGHTSLIGVCALIGADCGKVLDMEVMSSYCKGCDSYKGPKSNRWEVGGRPQCDKCGCRVRNCSQHRFTIWRQFQTTGTAIRWFSSGRPRGTTPADDRYIVLQARRNRRQTAGEIAETHGTGDWTTDIAFYRGQKTARWWSVCGRPVRCVPLTPAHRRRRSLWCREHQNWRDNECGRVLFTDESRFSLSSDSHRILIWRERGSRNHPSNIVERTGMKVVVFSFGEASYLVVVQTFTSSTQVRSTGTVIVTRFFYHMCVFLEAL